MAGRLTAVTADAEDDPGMLTRYMRTGCSMFLT